MKITIQNYEDITNWSGLRVMAFSLQHAGFIKTVGDRSYWVWVK